MKDIVVIGAGSLGKEVAQLIKDINLESNEWNLIGFIDETPEKHGTVINSYPVLGGFEWFSSTNGNIWSVCAVGNPRGRMNLIKKAKKYGVNFPNLIHPSVIKSDLMKIGVGNIICCNTFLSVNTKLGSHVIINPGCGIGHDTEIEDFVTLYWNVTLAGCVTIKEGCEIGSKAFIIQNKSMGKWSTLGAGAVALKDIPEGCVSVGVPAEIIKYYHIN